MDNSHNSMALAWNDIAHIYSLRERIIRQIDKFILPKFPPQADRALDIGSGTGSLGLTAARRYKFVTAIDISPEMIEISRKRAGNLNIEYINADFNTLDLKRDYFDFIFSVDTLHYLDIKKALIKIKAILKEGGTLLIADVAEFKESNFFIRLFERLKRWIHLISHLWQQEKAGIILILWSLVKYYSKWERHSIRMNNLGIKTMSFDEISRIAGECLPGCEIERLRPFGWMVISWRKNK